MNTIFQIFILSDVERVKYSTCSFLRTEREENHTRGKKNWQEMNWSLFTRQRWTLLRVFPPLSPSACLPCLSTSVRYHFWCSPGCSTSPPRPGKSSSSSCWVVKPPTAVAIPAAATTAAAWKEPRGQPARRGSWEGRRFLGALRRAASSARRPPP